MAKPGAAALQLKPAGACAGRTVVGHDTRELIVHTDMTGSSEDIGRLEVSAVQSSEGVRVTERIRQRSFLEWLGFNLHPVKVRFTIEVPREASSMCARPVAASVWTTLMVALLPRPPAEV